MNAATAHLSNRLRDLFPAPAVVAELRGEGDPGLLLAEETAGLGRSVPKRVREFAAGRACARRCLAELGRGSLPLPAGADRAPIWPSGIVGSITHTEGFCAAVAAERSAFAALGMDSEVVGRVPPEIWATVCTPQESDWVGSLPANERPAAVTLVFAAKEAFYKCQYPLVGEWLDFHDLSLVAGAADPSRGSWTLRAMRDLAISAHRAGPWLGRHLFHDGYVTAGISLPAQ